MRGAIRRWQAALAVAMCSAGAEAEGQGWVTMPNGSLAYRTDYTTSGYFSCARVKYLIGSCLASGSSMTLMYNGSIATFSFTPASGTIVATSNGKGNKVALGTLSVTYGGSGAPLFPMTSNKAVPLFRFGVVLNTTSPLAGSGGFGYAYYSKNNRLFGGVNDYFSLPLLPSPPGTGYRAFDIVDPTYSPIDPTFTSLDLSASAVITPEPATIALLSTGLLAVGGMVRRRRRSAADV